MIAKITNFLYENNIKKINEIIDAINSIKSAAYTESGDYVLQSSVGNEANKIPRYSAEGHLILPDGTEIY